MDFMRKDKASECLELPLVKMIELPLKETVSVQDVHHKITESDESSDCQDKKDESDTTCQTSQFEHDENQFCVNCSCNLCVDYRETVLQLINDHFKARSLWVILKRTMTKFYQPIVEKAPKSVNDMYHKLLEEERRYWIVNGIMNQAKLQHMDFISDLSPTDSMVFTLFTTLLSVDDPHQLLELMSYEVECFAKSYAEGLLAFIDESEEKLPSEKLITYVLDGYTALCQVAESMASFLFTFERNHLEQFSLTWIELNKRMYQEWVYSKFLDTMPKCIIELKDQVSSEQYASLVKQYIQFDEEMTSIKRKWRNVWLALNKYHMTEKEQERRKRIRIITQTFERIRSDSTIPFNEFIDIPDWEYCTNRELVWENMVAYVKRRWPQSETLEADVSMIQKECTKCQTALEFHDLNCHCNTCSIAGSPNLPRLCPNCLFLDITDMYNNARKLLDKHNNKDTANLDCIETGGNENERNTLNIVSKIVEAETNCEKIEKFEKFKGEYHISWAVFKHIKGRQKYPYDTIEEKYFCSDCKRIPCVLAKKILNSDVNYNLAKHLLNCYQPFSLPDEEMGEMMINVVLYISKLISMNLMVYDSPNDDVVVKTFWVFIISTIASYSAIGDLLQTESHHQLLSLKNLRINDDDISLPVELLESSQKPNEFLNFIEKAKGNVALDTQIAGKLQKLKKTLNSEKYNQTAPPKEESIKKELTNQSCQIAAASTKPRKSLEKQEVEKKQEKNPTCDENVTGKIEHSKNTKEQMFGKMCFHEKDCAHARINGTRDRLRRKLNEISNSKKPNVTIKKPSEEITKATKENAANTTLSNKMEKLEKIKNSKHTISSVSLVKTSSVSLVKTDGKEANSCKTNKKDNTKKRGSVSEENDGENLDEWVKDTLSFIEGKAQKTIPVADNKKAAKKAKQKQKKEEQKRIEELLDLRSQFYSLYCKEFISKNELKLQHTSKKKEKKKISDLESSIKKLSKAKSRIERNILELIASLKAGNPEFKFSYLPTKEQQEKILEDAQAKEMNKSNVGKSALPNTEEVKLTNVSEPIHSPPSNQQVRKELEELSLDPEKRMVTIRRVNLPHVSEPQVTVTAKGACAGKDKLLYTFINGQLVPASSLDSQTINVLQNNFSSNSNETDLCNRRSRQDQQPINRSNISMDRPNVCTPKETVSTKKCRSKNNSDGREYQNVQTEKNKPYEPTNNRSAADASKQAKKKNKNNAKSLENDLDSNKRREPPKGEILNQSVKSKENANMTVKQNCEAKNKENLRSRKQKFLQGECEDCADVCSESRHYKIVDNGQFDNNKFKMLHMDELSTDVDRIKLDDSKSDKKKNKRKSKMKVENSAVTNVCTQSQAKSVNQCLNSSSNQTKSCILKENYTNDFVNTEVTAERNYGIHNVPKFENILAPVNKSFQDLHISVDRNMQHSMGINETHPSQVNLNVSIMEQLNRGVQVEDLALPPGITLTKVDPTKAEALRAKRESISKLAQPLEPQNNRHQHPPVISPPMLSSYGRMDPNGVIMVDAMKSNSQMEDPSKNKKSKNRRKNKKKRLQGNCADGCMDDTTKLGQSKMITLRNPMFHAPGLQGMPMPLHNRLPIAPLPMDQPADIIKNENGMFTIRNPILNQAYSNGLPSVRHPQKKFHSSNENSSYSFFPNDGTYQNCNKDLHDNSRCISAIGSEVKTAHQQKQLIDQWSRNQNFRHENVPCGYMNGVNSSAQGYFDSFKGTDTNCSNMFDNNMHNCEESPPPSLGGFNPYLDGIPNSKYDDISFYKNLAPGQSLNSEVTIHNVAESKFGCNTQSMSHGVERTPISCCGDSRDFMPQKHHVEMQNDIFNSNPGIYRGNYKGLRYSVDNMNHKLDNSSRAENILLAAKSSTNTSSRYLEEPIGSLVHNMDSLNLTSGNCAINLCNKPHGSANHWW